MGSWYHDYTPRPTVAERARKAEKQVASLEKKGRKLSPIVLAGRTIAGTFWGKAWCQHLEGYSDYASRLPRGRSYVRGGSVIDLQIEPGRVTALVQGSRLYTVTIKIGAVEAARWKAIVAASSGKIDSVIELLQGKLSGAVMEILSHRETGLFPAPGQINLDCSCPDWATMCKHVAAVLYGVGARLDTQPDLLFRLRGTDPTELIATAAKGAALGGRAPAKEKRLGADLESVFGIDLDLGPAPAAKVKAAPPAAKVKAAPAPAPVKAKVKVAPAPVKMKVAAKAKAKPPAAVTITATTLRLLGVPPATVHYWLTTGVLVRTPVAGVYEETARTSERLARFRAREPA